MDDFLIKDGILKKYNGDGGSVEIPEGVIEISKNVFRDREDILSIKIPSSVMKINESAFLGCYGLADENGYVVVNGNLYDCEGYHMDIVIPNGVEKIQYYPEVKDITSIVIPQSVKAVEVDVFGHELENIHYRHKDSYFTYSWEFKRLVVSDELVKEWGLKGLKKRFDIEMLAVSMLAYPENYSSILKDTLLRYIKQRKEDIVKVLIRRDDIKRIENLCKFIRLKPFEIEEYFKYVSERYQENKNIIQFFEEKRRTDVSEKSVAEWRKEFKFTIKDGEVNISKYVGRETDIVIPEMIGKNKVVGIGSHAFECPFWLQTISIPETVREIGSYAFQKTRLEELVIPHSIKKIEFGTFYKCSELRLVVLPNDLKEIENYAFWGCKSLERIELPKGLEVIGCRAFVGCENLKEIIIPESVKIIEGFAFNDCKKMDNIVLQNKKIDVGRRVFDGCPGIEQWYDKHGFLIINDVLLDYNGACTDVQIPEGVKIMRASCFHDKNVRKITIPKSVNVIEDFAVIDCPLLEEIIIWGNDMETEIQEEAFYSCDNLKIIHR